MTPFGAKLRALRAERGVTQRVLAAELRVSPAYLSALEHGRRGAPSAGLVHQVNEFFGLIWDEAEELSRLARQSRPKVSIDTGGLAPEQTALANRLAQTIRRLPPDSVAAIHAILDAVPPPVQRRGTQAITTGRSGLGRKLNSSRNGLPRDTVHPAYSPASSWYSARCASNDVQSSPT